MSAGVVDRPLTDQQRQALQRRDRSVSLSAGAGCGKTFVLTERFLSQVDPTQAEAADLEELVAITFTDAAAREMRDRIRRRCFERMQTAANNREAAAWQRLLRSMDAARISTIHSFCMQLLRTYAAEAGLDPQFEVLDAPAAELLKLETIDDRLRKLLLASDDDTLELAARRGLERLRNDLAALAGPRSAETVARWRDASPQELVSQWQRFYDERIAPQAFAELCRSPELAALRRLCDASCAKSDHLSLRLTHLAAALDALPKSCAGDCGKLISAIVAQARVNDIRGAKHWHDLDDYEPLKQACERVRDVLKKCVIGQPADFSAAHEAAEQGLTLLRLVADVSESLEGAKTRRNMLEFDDLLARAHRLLTDPTQPAIRQQIAQRTRLLMVDEFQDTNPLQVSIIKASCGEEWQQRGLFAVGDFKQSIYRFNGAEPRVSTSLRAELPPAGRLSLTRNFRSQPAITNFVNAVFHGEFEEYERLEPARAQLTDEPAVEFLWTPGERTDEAEASEAESPEPELVRPPGKKRRRAGAVREARVTEAHWIARRLVQLLKSDEPLVVDMRGGEPTPRRLQLGDIAILLRTLSDAQVYEEALREHGLAYYLAGGHAFYSQQEIYDVLNLLRAVGSTVDEIALAGALRSPLFSLRDETLFWMASAYGTLNAALAAGGPAADANGRGRLPRLPAEELAKIRRASRAFDRLREEKDRLLVADLLALALELTGFDAVLLTEFLGPRKAANIEKLIEQARALDRTSPGDLQGFITQLSEFVLRAPKEALAATQAEGDVVRIMTIHYAKGLEFPLVVLPDLDRQRHAGTSQPVLDAELGPLMPLDAEDNGGWSGLDLYRHVENLEDLEERKRLLYVACTRAADYLMLSSSIVDPAEPKRDWLQLVHRHVSLVDGALQQPLPPGYEAPRIRVTTDRPRIDDEPPSVPRGADLERLVKQTRELAAKSSGEVPRSSDATPPDGAARRQFSFSQLTGQLARSHGATPEGERRESRREHGGTGLGAGGAMELGLLVHAVLEQIDFRRQDGAASLCEFLAPQVAVAAPGRTAAVAAPLIERFLRTPRAAELAAAAVVRREVEFLLPWPPDGEGPGRRYLHGFIDCLYQDPQGRWRLLDYKTNDVAADAIDTLAERYELQMLVYALACEQALGEPLAECALIALAAGREHVYRWDAALRGRGIDSVTQAIDALSP